MQAPTTNTVQNPNANQSRPPPRATPMLKMWSTDTAMVSVGVTSSGLLAIFFDPLSELNDLTKNYGVF